MKVQRASKYELDIASYKPSKKDSTAEVFNGKSYRIIPLTQFYQERKKNLFLQYGTHFIKLEKGKSLEETRNDFIRDATLLKSLTKGLINMFKTGAHTTTALHLLNHFNSQVPDPITPQEGDWIANVPQGALMFSTEYEGEAWKEDFTTFYPSLMADSHMLLPFKEGTFECIHEFGRDWAVAIYRCSIEVKDFRLFRKNDRNYYTSTDVRRARELGYKIELIHDGKPNILFWERSKCITGSQVFGPYVQYLFEIKRKQKVQSAKTLLNCIWGVLTQSAVFTKVTDKFELHEGTECISMSSAPGGKKRLRLVKNGRLFRYDWARIKPFILAKGRTLISKTMEKHIDDVVRCHTDGIVTKCKLPNITNGDGLGEIKFEGYALRTVIDSRLSVKPKGIWLAVNSAELFMEKFIEDAKNFKID